jgi:uncharacterized membrane protein YbhN (UPF0104 family)
MLAATLIFWHAHRRPEGPYLLHRIADRIGLGSAFRALCQATHEYARNLSLIRTVLGISFLSQGLILVSFILLGITLDMGVPLMSYLVLVPLGLLVTAVPIAPAGLGVGQVAFLALFRMAGSSQGANLFTLYMAACVLINLVGALLVPFLRLSAPVPATASLARAQRQ